MGRWLGLGLPPAAQSGPSVRSSRALGAFVSCGFAALTLDCRSCGPGFGWSSGEVKPRAPPGVGGSFPVAETLSTAGAAVLTLVVLSALALPFRDGSKEHQGEGGRVGQFVGPHGGARPGLHPEGGESS